MANTTDDPNSRKDRAGGRSEAETMNGVNASGTDRYEKRRRRSFKKKLFIIPKLFFVFAVVFIIVSMMLSHGDTVETFTAMKGSIEEYVLADGYIFRDQELINSPSSGYLECYSEEGARVNEGDVIAAVYDGEVDPAVTEEIAHVKSEIKKLSDSSVRADIYAASAAKIELNIADLIYALTETRENNEFSDIAGTKETVNDYIGSKQTALGNGKTDEERLNELNAELNRLEGSISASKSDITAPRAGVFSSKIDGYENALSIDMMGDATPVYLNNLKRENVSSSANVSSGEPVCKIIDNYEWYFVGNISEKEAENFSVGDSISLRFYELSDSVISGTVTAMSKAEGGKIAITVYSTKYVESIYSTSKVSAELLTESSSGIKIPSAALRVIDGKQGVYVVRLGVARFVPIELIYNNKEWAIISRPDKLEDGELSLEIYDEVIVDTKGIEEGKVVRQ